MSVMGKFYRRTLFLSFLGLLGGMTFSPLLSSNGGTFPIPDFGSFEFSNGLYHWLLCAWYVSLDCFIAFLASSLFAYAIYFIQRQWCLHKYRKPVMIYKGSGV